MEISKINRENQKNKLAFEEILEIIKKCKSEAVTEVLFNEFNYTEIKLGSVGDDSFSIKLDNKFSSLSKNDETLCYIDKEYHKKWLKFAKEEFKRQYGAV